MSRQIDHTEEFFSVKKFPLILLTDDVTGEANLGALFRLADAFNIEKLIFCGSPVNINSNRLRRTARATEKTVAYEYRENALEVLQQYITQDYKIGALEITTDSLPLDSLFFGNEEKMVLVLGNERDGISTEVLKLASLKLHITMFGRNSSMNVAQAAAIALYEITKTLPPCQD